MCTRVAQAKGAGNNAQVAVVKGELGGKVTRRARHTRPQDKFESKVDNSRAPFVPLVRAWPDTGRLCARTRAVGSCPGLRDDSVTHATASCP